MKPSNIIFVNGVPRLADIGLVAGVEARRLYVLLLAAVTVLARPACATIAQPA